MIHLTKVFSSRIQLTSQEKSMEIQGICLAPYGDHSRLFKNEVFLFCLFLNFITCRYVFSRNMLQVGNLGVDLNCNFIDNIFCLFLKLHCLW